jgi:DNA-binding NtrC family response regulator
MGMDWDLPQGVSILEAAAALTARLERAWIVKALAESGGNQTRAARRLGIDPRTLYAKLRRHQLGSSGEDKRP